MYDEGLLAISEDRILFGDNYWKEILPYVFVLVRNRKPENQKKVSRTAALWNSLIFSEASEFSQLVAVQKSANDSIIVEYTRLLSVFVKCRYEQDWDMLWSTMGNSTMLFSNAPTLAATLKSELTEASSLFGKANGFLDAESIEWVSPFLRRLVRLICDGTEYGAIPQVIELFRDTELVLAEQHTRIIEIVRSGFEKRINPLLLWHYLAAMDLFGFHRIGFDPGKY